MNPLSLRSQLLLLVGGPFVILLLVEAIVSYRIGLHSANQIYDEWLVDRAEKLLVGYSEGHDLNAELPALGIKNDQYEIIDAAGNLLSGSVLAADRPDSPSGAPVFRLLTVQASPVRAVSIQRDTQVGNLTVTVVEEVTSRSENNYTLLVDVLISNSLVVLLALLMIGTAFGRGLRPLTHLSGELAQRSPQDLTPIDVGSVPTELRGVVENTNSLLARIDTAISTREQFIGNIAHQIRTPLAGIKLQAQLAEDELEEKNPALLATLKRISEAADAMTHVNSQLMKLARAEAAMGRGLRREPVDLAAVSRQSCAALGALANQKQISLHVSASNSCYVAGELTLLSEMVSNLVENAILYTQSEGNVWVTVSADEDGFEFTVEDDGPGIDEAEWPQIFERFFRSPSHSVSDREGEGCGLGLAIVREIALAHDASVDVGEGRAGCGARFTVRFSAASKLAAV